MKILGIVLIIVGVIALVYGGFSYTTTKKAVDMGPIQIDRKENHSVPAAAGAGRDRHCGWRRAALFRSEEAVLKQFPLAVQAVQPPLSWLFSKAKPAGVNLRGHSKCFSHGYGI